MSALNVAHTRPGLWKVTFANPHVNLVDPANDAFVDDLASEIAGYDRQALADAKALVDRVSLPADADLVEAYQTFFRSVARLAA